VKRFGEAGLTRAGFAAVFLAQVTLGFSHSLPPLLLVSFLSSFGNGVLRPSITSLITRSVGRHEQGVALGFNQSINSVAQIVAPVLAGFLISKGQLSLWAWVAALSALGGFWLSRTVPAPEGATVARSIG
jgi:predicted MFS family arabinose efflux permease